MVLINALKYDMHYITCLLLSKEQKHVYNIQLENTINLMRHTVHCCKSGFTTKLDIIVKYQKFLKHQISRSLT